MTTLHGRDVDKDKKRQSDSDTFRKCWLKNMNICSISTNLGTSWTKTKNKSIWL